MQGKQILYRPKFHFTPNKYWINDPNGMFYLDGIYHLYYQYYPKGNEWGPMHWGHATSKDLISWVEHDIALYPDHLGYIFSGSAVVDHENTSGLGNENTIPIVAIFTHHNPQGEKDNRIDYQNQSIAYSLDHGHSWIKYEGNPVLRNPGIKDFRDPKVVWDNDRSSWLMVLSTYSETLFYSSKNLIDWQYLSSFGKDFGAHGGVWECPDFFPLTVEPSGEKKWVLLQSINPGGSNGGSATQYFIGDFDGVEFIIDSDFKKQLDSQGALWIDYGRDNYAGVTWSNIPKTDGRRLSIGWMSNWEYANKVPTENWRGGMTIPRELSLELSSDNRYTLYSKPVRELFEKCKVIDSNISAEAINEFNFDSPNYKSEIIFEIGLNNLTEDIYTFSWQNNSGDTLLFGIDNTTNTLFVKKESVVDKDLLQEFENSVSTCKLRKKYTNLKLLVIIDKTSIEIFVNDGEYVMTEIFFPKVLITDLSLTSKSYFTIDYLKTYIYH